MVSKVKKYGFYGAITHGVFSYDDEAKRNLAKSVVWKQHPEVFISC